MTDPNGFEDLDQMLRTLQSAFDLKEKRTISEAEYERIKEKVLGYLESRLSTPTGEVARTEEYAAIQEARIALYAGDLHRMIVQQIAREYLKERIEVRKYLTETMSKLIEAKALLAADMVHMTRLIDIVCDDDFGKDDTRMLEGVARITEINDAVRLDPNTSALAKTITGIAHDSAQNVALGRISKDKDSATPTGANQMQPKQSKRHTLWGTVKDDVSGAFSGASAIGTIMAVPGFPIAWLGVLSVLGPPAAVAPILGAVVGAGLLSGIEYARQR